MNEIINKIESVITPILDTLNFDLVRISITGDSLKTIQIMAEPKNHQPMLVKDCALISKKIKTPIDDLNLFENYELEISSPGIERPLMKLPDYMRFIGFDAKIELINPNENGQKRFKGQILGVKENAIHLKTETTTEILPFNAILKAKLLLSDNNIKLYQERN